jgi:hypothetical protein
MHVSACDQNHVNAAMRRSGVLQTKGNELKNALGFARSKASVTKEWESTSVFTRWDI